MKNKKAVVTGSSGGIGKVISQFLTERAWEVTGLCRSSGFDLNESKHDFKAICQDHDLIVNCAPAIFGQVQFLYDAYEVLRDRDSLIINISSNNCDGIRPYPHIHASSKKALEHATVQLQYEPSKCRVVLLKLGYIDSPRAEKYDQPKLGMEKLVETFSWILSAPSEMLIRELYISHKDMRLDI